GITCDRRSIAGIVGRMNGINWFSFTAADGYDYGLTLPLLCLAAVIVFTAVLMNYTRLGRQVYAMGGNRDAAS
ncbi:hypothetical protein FDX22_22700, partial [Citrobacter sp. TBCS-14]